MKFRCRRCGEKHIVKSKCTKHVSFGALFEVQMSKNCTPLWRKAHSEVKMLKKLTVSEHFLKFRCRKIARRCGETHIVKSKCKKTSVSEHFLKFRCRKIARRCGEKHIVKSKCTKHVSFGALFEVQMSKNCTPLRRKTHCEVKMYKTRQFRSTF